MLIHELVGIRDFRYLDKEEIHNPPKGLIASNAYVGMEFEFEKTGAHFSEILGIKRYKPLQKWYTTHEDGSLRGADAVEFVFGQPLHAPHAFDAMKTLLEIAKANEFAVSKRTGFHVHLNVGDLEVEQMWNLAQLYCLFEPAIYTAIGDSRSGSIFCIPWFKDLHLSQSVAGIMKGRSSVQLCRNFGKYSGLNLRAVSEKGSMEFRHMRNCYDVERMTHWLNFILALHKKATSPDFAGWYSEILAKKNYRSGILDLYKGEKVPHWEALIYPELEDEINQLTLDSAYELQYLASKPKMKFKPVVMEELGPINGAELELRAAAAPDREAGPERAAREALAHVRRDIEEARANARTATWGRVVRNGVFDDNFLMPNEERR